VDSSSESRSDDEIDIANPVPAVPHTAANCEIAKSPIRDFKTLRRSVRLLTGRQIR